MKSSTDKLVLAPDAPIDLQLHTVLSDGKWTPETLIDHLLSEGFALGAITDHDRVDSVAGIQEIAVEKHMPMLVAAEMTTKWNNGITDVLCFGFDPSHPTLNDLAQQILKRQQDNTRQVYEYLRSKGYGSDIDELPAMLEKPVAQQPHELFDFMERQNIAEDMMMKLAKEGGYGLATNETGAVVDAVHQAGGLAIIAHPGHTGGFINYDADLFDKLRAEIPIDGIEVYHPAHTPERVALYEVYAQKHNLLTSSGSDSHRPDKPPIKYPAAHSRTLLERLGIQVKS